jgi:hypothetical protein
MDDRKIVVRFPSEKRYFLFTATPRMALKLTPVAGKRAWGRKTAEA